MPRDIAALRALLVGKKITDLAYDAETGMLMLEVGGRYALIPLMDPEGNGYGALQWMDMKSDAQGVVA